MASYESAFSTSLGDYLSIRASHEGCTKRELEEKLIIEPILTFGNAIILDPVEDAIKKFNKRAQEYEVVVELKEGPVNIGWFGIFASSYRIRGTGIRKRDLPC